MYSNVKRNYTTSVSMDALISTARQLKTKGRKYIKVRKPVPEVQEVQEVQKVQEVQEPQTSLPPVPEPEQQEDYIPHTLPADCVIPDVSECVMHMRTWFDKKLDKQDLRLPTHYWTRDRIVRYMRGEGFMPLYTEQETRNELARIYETEQEVQNLRDAFPHTLRVYAHALMTDDVDAFEHIRKDTRCFYARATLRSGRENIYSWLTPELRQTVDVHTRCDYCPQCKPDTISFNPLKWGFVGRRGYETQRVLLKRSHEDPNVVYVLLGCVVGSTSTTHHGLTAWVELGDLCAANPDVFNKQYFRDNVFGDYTQGVISESVISEDRLRVRRPHEITNRRSIYDLVLEDIVMGSNVKIRHYSLFSSTEGWCEHVPTGGVCSCEQFKRLDMLLELLEKKADDYDGC